MQTKTTYFQNPQSLEELKKQYRQLAKKYHPDTQSGSNEKMKIINVEYDYLFKILKNTSTNKQDQYQDVNDSFRTVINNIINIDSIEIEIIGSWIWVSGNTYSHKETLKKNGFQWSKSKKSWYWMPEAQKTKKKRKGYYTKQQIREKYGSDIIKEKKENIQLTA